MTKQKKLDGILESLYSQGVDYGTELFYLMAITQAKKEIIGLLLKPKEIEIIIALHKVFYSKPKMGCLEKVATALVTKQKERFV